MNITGRNLLFILLGASAIRALFCLVNGRFEEALAWVVLIAIAQLLLPRTNQNKFEPDRRRGIGGKKT